MKISLFISLFLAAFLCAGCGPSKEEKDDESRKKSMGDGNIKVDRSPIGGL